MFAARSINKIESGTLSSQKKLSSIYKHKHFDYIILTHTTGSRENKHFSWNAATSIYYWWYFKISKNNKLGIII